MLAIKPFAHGSEGVAEIGSVDAYFDGSHERALRLPIWREHSSLSAIGANGRTDDRLPALIKVSVAHRT
jgi:hypothetical protein